MMHVCASRLARRLEARASTEILIDCLISTRISCAILQDLAHLSFHSISKRFVQPASKMNRIILALAALVGQATAFAPAVAPRPATQLQASKFDAGAKAAASLAASLALAGAVLTPDAAFAATATQAGGVCAAAPDSEVCRQSKQVKAKAASAAPKAAAKPAAKKPAKKAAPAKKKVRVDVRSNGAFRSRRRGRPGRVSSV
jgi:hypothetical protein